MGVGGQRLAPNALPPTPPGKTRYPLCSRLGGPQGRSGRVWKMSPLLGFDPRAVQAVVSHCIGRFNNNNNNNNNIYLLQLGCYPVAVVILHVNKT